MATRQQDPNLRLVCRDCKDQVPNIVEDFSAGDLICGNCGLVLGNRIIDTRSEWRTFAGYVPAPDFFEIELLDECLKSNLE